MKKLSTLVLPLLTLISLTSCSTNNKDDYILVKKDLYFLKYLTYGDILNMKKIYAKNLNENNKYEDPYNDILFEGYYGTYFIGEEQEKVHIVSFFPYDSGHTADVKKIKIGEYELVYPTLIPNAFYDNKFYSLNEAYESSIIDNNILERLSKTPNLLNPKY